MNRRFLFVFFVPFCGYLQGFYADFCGGEGFSRVAALEPRDDRVDAWLILEQLNLRTDLSVGRYVNDSRLTIGIHKRRRHLRSQHFRLVR